MKCLVLGGSGFIGSALSRTLIQHGHHVRILARPKSSPPALTKNIEWVYGDFLNTHDLRVAVKDIDIIFHLVSTTFPKSANDDPVWDVQSNLVGTLQLLQVLREHPVKKIIFISSGGAVYGPPHYLPLDEKHPTDPITAYGITKLAIEKHLHLFSYLYSIPSLILRVSNPYGQQQRIENNQGAASVFLHHALAGIPIEIWGDGETLRDYIHIDDVAEACRLAMMYTGKHQLFNVGSGQGTSLNKLIDTIEQVVNHPVKRIYQSARAFDVKSNVLDITLIKNEFLWEPKISLLNGLKDFCT